MSVVLFDMDGVLFDTEGIYKKRFKEFLEYKGYRVDDAILNLFVGSNTKRDGLILNEYIDSKIDYQEFLHERRDYFRNRPVDYRNVLFDDVLPCLKALKKNGHHLTVVSSSPLANINQLLSLFDMSKYFDHIVSGEDFNESKPNPQVYFYAKHLYSDYDTKFYVVEDSTIGIEAATKANTIVIARKDDRYGFDQSSANYIVNSLSELTDIVK